MRNFSGSIKRKLALRFTLIIILIVAIFEGLFLASVHLYYFTSAKEALVNRAVTSTSFFNTYIPGYKLSEKAHYILESIPANESAKVEIIDWQGNIIRQSYGYVSSDRIVTQDVQEALRGQTGVWSGQVQRTGESVLAVSNPLKDMDTTIGVLRYSVSMESIEEAVNQITLISVVIGIVVIAAFILISLLMSQRIVEPIQELTQIAALMAKGDFTSRVKTDSTDEIGKLGATFNYMADELVKNEKLKSDFISSVSHELRTPLTSIKGWSETLITGDLDDKQETTQGLQVISRETDRLAGLVEELLDFSRFQSGEMKMELHPIDLRHVLEEVRHQYGFRPGGTISFSFEIGDQPLVVMGDLNRLKQVCINILDNAVKFTRHRPDGMILVKAWGEGGYVHTRFFDNGAGISSEDLPKVTAKFYKGKSNQSGSGLGLAICKEILTLHQGELSIHSTEGKGTEVCILLPACKL